MKNHNMAMNMVDVVNPLREALNEFLIEKTNYADLVVTRFAKHSSSSFPLIELKQLNSISGEEDLNRYEQTDILTFELNIYAKSEIIEGEIKTEVEIAEELMYLVNEFFDVKFGMRRTLCEPTPNLDRDIYRITMRYTCAYNKRRNKFTRR